MAAQLASVKAFLSSHETLDPPSAGKWSILRTHSLPGDFNTLLGSLTVDTLPIGSPERTEVIRILWDWLAVWDVYCWPADGAQSRASFEECGFQLHQLDTVRWEMVQLMRFDVPSRIAETHEHCVKLLAWVKWRRDFNIANGEIVPPLIETEPQVALFLYAGVALAQAGVNNPLAEKHLRDGTTHLGKLGSVNPLWALGSLERVLRAQGKDDEALVMAKCASMAEIRNSREELALTRGNRNAPAFHDDFKEWGQAMLSVITEAGFSALELFRGAANSKVATHILAIHIVWIPDGVQPINRFKMISAGVFTNAEVNRFYPLELPKLAQLIEAFEERDKTAACLVGGTAYGRTIITSEATGINAELQGSISSFLTEFTPRVLAEKPHDAGWVESLKSKRAQWGYDFE
ncbi:hypothetical protein RQP46_002428 [Phenoliferia psychrophenolica]